MNSRSRLFLLLPTLCLALSSCSWFSDNDYPVTAAPSVGETAQVVPVGQTPAAPAAPGTHAFGAGAPSPYAAAPGAGAAAYAPPAAAPAAPAANEKIVQHTVVSGDSLWKLSRQYGTTIDRIKQVNQLTTDDIWAGKTILIPTTSPPAGATTVPAPATPSAATPAPTTRATTPVIPSATNPVVQPLPTVPPATGDREPVAIPRPGGSGF